MPFGGLAGHKEPVCVSYTTMTIVRKFKFTEEEAGSKPIVYLLPEVWKGEDIKQGEVKPGLSH